MHRMFTILAVVAIAVGCGGSEASDGSDSGADSHPGGDTTGPSGLDSDESLASLDASQRAALCDWIASLFGGYAKEQHCSDGSEAGSFLSQDSCVNDAIFKDGSCTVGDFEKCEQAFAALTDRCVAVVLPECTKVAACATPKP